MMNRVKRVLLFVFVSAFPIVLSSVALGDPLPENKQDRQTSTVELDAGQPSSLLTLAESKEAAAPAEALQLYKRAAAAGEVLAQIKLGRIYELGGLGARSNPRLAFSFYEKASTANFPAGDFHLARCYESGIGVSTNALRSTRLFRKSALGGVVAANVVMARRYLEGQGVEADPVAAIGWLIRGANAGSSEAMVLLGQRYEKGDAIPQNYNLAGHYYSNAAKAGDPTGRYHLAMLYLAGKGTVVDPIQAYVLLALAQELPAAKDAFEKLVKEMTPDQLALAKQKTEAEQKQK